MFPGKGDAALAAATRMALRDAGVDHLAHEIVIDHFLDVVLCRRGVLQGNVQLDVEDDALGGVLLEIMDADVHRRHKPRTNNRRW